MSQVFSTGSSGTIGKHLPETVKSLALRLDEDFDLAKQYPELRGQALIHLAGVVGERQVEESTNSNEINVDKTIELGRQSLALGIRKFVFASTSHVYAPALTIVSENSPLGPISKYGLQKLKAELGLLEVFKNQPEKLVIARIFSILDRQMAKFSLGGLAEEILRNSSGVTVQNSTDVRDFLDSTTVAQALTNLALSMTSHGAYNICSGKGMSVKEAIKFFVTSSGGTLDGTSFQVGISQRPFLVGSNDRLKRDCPEIGLNWTPKTN